MSSNRIPAGGADRGRAAPVAVSGLARLTQPALAPAVSFEPLELDGQAFARHAGEAPFTRAARRALLRALRQRLLAAGASEAQCAPLDEVAEIFDAVLDGAGLPATAQPLLWRLQAPVAKLALLDAGYLRGEPRVLHRLVEDIAALLTAALDGPAATETHRHAAKLIEAIERLAGALQWRAALLTTRLGEQLALTAGDLERLLEQSAQERAGVAAARGALERRNWRLRPDRVREREATERLRGQLEVRLDAADATLPVRAFVQDVWLRHVRSAVLRDGEAGASYRLAMRTLDELLGTIAAHGPAPDRDRLARRIPPTLRELSEGIRATGARDSDWCAFFGELFRLHLRGLGRAVDGSGGTGGIVRPPLRPET